jgi:hypothetical protein
MSIGSSERMGLDPAPGGLGLVQDLVNTSLADEPQLALDLLATLDGAQTWLGAALPAWSAATGRTAPAIILTDADLEPLRLLREHTRDALRRDNAPAGGGAGTVRIELELATDGEVAHQPVGKGWSTPSCYSLRPPAPDSG